MELRRRRRCLFVGFSAGFVARDEISRFSSRGCGCVILWRFRGQAEIWRFREIRKEIIGKYRRSRFYIKGNRKVQSIIKYHSGSVCQCFHFVHFFVIPLREESYRP
jgi:hypothetical protein